MTDTIPKSWEQKKESGVEKKESPKDYDPFLRSDEELEKAFAKIEAQVKKHPQERIKIFREEINFTQHEIDWITNGIDGREDDPRGRTPEEIRAQFFPNYDEEGLREIKDRYERYLKRLSNHQKLSDKHFK